MLRITGIVIACLFFAFPAQARHYHSHHGRHFARVHHAHHRQVVAVANPNCNIFQPCPAPLVSARGLRVVKAMGGLGEAAPVRAAKIEHRSEVVEHPAGCPRVAFCGCGAAVRLGLSAASRHLWLAANWFKFPRAAAAPGTVAVRRHHVFVLEADLGGGLWRVYDANSGGHATRIHARSIAGYTIVSPRA